MVPRMQNNRSPLTSRALVIVLLVLSLVSITFYSREDSEGFLHAIQNGVSGVVAPLKFVGTAAGSVGEGLATSISDATADESTLSGLRQQNSELRSLLAQAEEYRIKSQEYEKLLEIKDTFSVVGPAAHIIGRSTDAWNQTITIDVGSDEGVSAGLTVMGTSGVIGQVVAAEPASSTVRLLSDPSSGAAAMIQSSRVEGIVRGSLDGLLYLENVAADVAVNVGDVVLTSGLGGSYIRGLMIGTVARVEGNLGDVTRLIIVTPNQTVSAMEEVLVVVSAEAPSIASQTPSNDSGGESS